MSHAPWRGEGGGGNPGGREQFQPRDRPTYSNPPPTGPRGGGYDRYTPHGGSGGYQHSVYSNTVANNYNHRGMSGLPPRPPPPMVLPMYGYGYGARPKLYHDGERQQPQVPPYPSGQQQGGWPQQPGQGLQPPLGRRAHTPPTPPRQGPAQRQKQQHNKPQPPPQQRQSPNSRTATPPNAPIATAEYLERSRLPPEKLSSPKELLVILDLNGTLLYRAKGKSAHGSSAPTLRPGLAAFLNYVTDNFKVMIWTSARPENATRMINAAFSNKQKQQLLAVWARDTLGLTESQYNAKVQVYKTLERIWNGEFAIKDTGAFDQTNTVLFDDSTEKAVGHPYNLVCVPEFFGTRGQNKGDTVLRQCIEYLEKLRWQSDISAYIRAYPFEPVTGSGEGDGPAQKDRELSADEDEGGVELRGWRL